MPTGYTASVADGKVTDFRTFALQCARQFGACVAQRDDPMDAPPKLVEPSQYHAKALAEAEARLVELQAMTVEEAGKQADAEHAKAVEERERYRNTRRDTQRRYEAMIEKVETWKSPTSDHAELRLFMLSQLRESMDFDCREYDQPPLVHLSGEAWLVKRRGELAASIGRHREEHRKELERTAERNAWIQALYDSLT